VPRMTKAREAAVRQRILEAGIAVFERHGFASASMTAIAAEAGLSAGGLYTHFSSKEELFFAAFATLVAEEEQALEAAIRESQATATAIDLAIDYVAQVAAGDRARFRGAGSNFLLHAWATAEDNAALREMLLARRASASRLARAVVESAIARGELPPDLDAEGLGLAFTSLLDGLFLQRAERGDSFTVDDARRQARAVVDAIFRAGPTRPRRTTERI
jgi:AcrR family transcriptional regulator